MSLISVIQMNFKKAFDTNFLNRRVYDQINPRRGRGEGYNQFYFTSPGHKVTAN